MKETLISGKFLFSQTCCTVPTSRRLGYIVLATGGLNPGTSGLARHTDRYKSVHYSWRLPLLRQPQSMADPQTTRRRRPVLSLRSGPSWIIIAGPATKTAFTRRYLVAHSKEVIAGHLGSCQGSHEDPLEVQYCNSYGTWFPPFHISLPLFAIPRAVRSPFRCGAGNGPRPRFSDER